MSGAGGQLLIAVAGGLVAALVTAGLSFFVLKLTLRHQLDSDRRADQRRLREQLRSRIQASVGTVLKASLAVGQVAQESQAIWQTETSEARDARHGRLLDENLAPLNDARVLLMLEAVAKDLVKIVDSQILAGFNRYRSAYFFDRAHPGTDARKELSVEYENLEKAIEKLRAEALRVFQELDKPI